VGATFLEVLANHPLPYIFCHQDRNPVLRHDELLYNFSHEEIVCHGDAQLYCKKIEMFFFTIRQTQRNKQRTIQNKKWLRMRMRVPV
jgi:hypothetical protein